MRYIRNEPLLLLFGDVFVFYVSLWMTLFLRGFSVPTNEMWMQHAIPFSFLFFVSVIVYFIAGLYDQHTLLLRSKLPSLVGYSQTITVVLAALFFFFVPYFGITPKTILVIFLLVSSALIVVWRLVLTKYVGIRYKQKGVLVLGSGNEIEQLTRELSLNKRYGLHIRQKFDPKDVEVSDVFQEQILKYITKKDISVVIVDARNSYVSHIMPVLYNLLFLHPKLSILDASQLYENIFRRIPISMLEDSWFIMHVTRQPHLLYSFCHRVFDVAVSLVLGVVFLFLLPIVALAIKLDDRGPLFSFQRRVGKDGKPLDLVKFRTMTVANDGGKWGGVNKVTRVGNFLRITRIDELPQLWNVLKGGYSLIGPRPEFLDAVNQYTKEIPYYNARHLITPGLSGWAQLNHHAHPHHGVDIEETRNKLSYDLYYLKNRSFWLDFEIGMKTIKTLLLAAGK